MSGECADTSTVSAGDLELENIIETETPPQSPAVLMSCEKPVTRIVNSDRRRCSIIVSVDDDDDEQNDVKTSDRRARNADADTDVPPNPCPLPDSTQFPLSPVSSSPGSPVAFSMCPLRLGKTFAFSSADGEARSANAAAEAFIHRQQEQVTRIAEYHKRSSLIDETQLIVSCIAFLLAL